MHQPDNSGNLVAILTESDSYGHVLATFRADVTHYDALISLVVTPLQLAADALDLKKPLSFHYQCASY
jgi:hypothetical protein